MKFESDHTGHARYEFKPHHCPPAWDILLQQLAIHRPAPSTANQKQTKKV